MLLPPTLPTSATLETRHKGFVLVSVLLIVALATVLVVVASMMSQIERRAAANSAKIEQARGNALFALDVALNQLQREAGPDQRVTARAEILDSDAATTNVEGVAQQYWAGVWKTGTNGLDVVNSGTPQRQISLGSTSPTLAQKATNAVWLVSGTNATYNPITYTGVTSGTNANAVILAKNLGPSPTNVVVPLVPMQSGSGTNGAYAYWVSDEGVKAKVNLADPTLGASASGDPSLSQAHFFAPQATAGHKGITAFNGTDVRADTNLPKVTTLQSLARLSSAPAFGGTNAALFSPDTTVVSRGVLSDVRRGGLKKDLTAGLENTASFTTLMSSYGNGASMLYRSASSEGLTVPVVDTGVTPSTDGLFWQNLFFHYNSYKGSMPTPVAVSGSPTPVTPTGSGNPATLPQVQSFRAYSVSVSGQTAKLGSLMPTPIAYRVDIALSSYQSGGTWKLRLHYYPQLVLWNPYSVRLTFPSYQFRRDVGAFATAGTPTTLTLTIAGTALAPVVLNPTPSSGRLQLQTRLGDCATLEPGETRVFALDADTSKSTVIDAVTFTDLVSNANMSADYSQYSDVPGFAGTPTGSDKVNAALSQLKLRCQNIDTFAIPSSLKWPRNDGSVRYLASGGWDISAAASAWDPNLQIQQLNGAPRRIIGFYVRQKGLLPSSSTNIYSNAGSSIPLGMGNSATLTPIDDAFSFAWQEVYLSPLGTLYQNGQTDVQIAPSGSYWETSFGSESAGVAAPGMRFILRDVPSQPLISLGQFMHMPAINFWSIGSYQLLGMGSLFVGGSCASPVIATDANARAIQLGTAGGSTANMKLFLDDSFLSNEALFDRFFFSTVPPSGLTAGGTTYPTTWTAFNAANSGSSLADATKPLLNARMKPYFKDGIAPKMADLRDVEKAAANLMLDGAFNINSTSVPAWRAFLGGLSGNDIRLWDATQKTAGLISPGTGTPVSRFWSGSGRTASNQPWSGLRVLSDSELTELATRIVEQVKTRGPFLSMADFLNRRLGPTDALTRCGTLQSAIDTMTPDINAAAKAVGVTVNATSPPEANRVPDLIPANMKDAKGNTWSTALGIPGYLMQQDLVQAFSPAMVARSDTFLVRAYGQVRNPRSGAIEGLAWAEAVVQRIPELVDSSQAAETAPASLNTTNQTLGRRFKVVSFRWLNENEI